MPKFTIHTKDGKVGELNTDTLTKIITPPDVIKAILINTPTDEKDFKFQVFIQDGYLIGYSGGTLLRIPIDAPKWMRLSIPRATMEVVLAKVKSHKFNHEAVTDNPSKQLGFYWNEAEKTGWFETDLFTESFSILQPELTGFEQIDFSEKFRNVNKKTEVGGYSVFHSEIMEKAVKTAKLVDKRGYLNIVCNYHDPAYMLLDNALTEYGFAEMLLQPKLAE